MILVFILNCRSSTSSDRAPQFAHRLESFQLTLKQRKTMMGSNFAILAHGNICRQT